MKNSVCAGVQAIVVISCHIVRGVSPRRSHWHEVPSLRRLVRFALHINVKSNSPLSRDLGLFQVRYLVARVGCGYSEALKSLFGTLAQYWQTKWDTNCVVTSQSTKSLQPDQQKCISNSILE